MLATEHLRTQSRLANRIEPTVALVFLCGRAITTYTGGPNMHMSVTDALSAGAAHNANTRVGIWLSLVAMKIGMNDSHTMHVLHVAGVYGSPHTPARRDEHISCFVESAGYLARHERIAKREQQQHERQHKCDSHVALFERLAKIVHDICALVVVDDWHVVGHRQTQQQPHAVQNALRASRSMKVWANLEQDDHGYHGQLRQWVDVFHTPIIVRRRSVRRRLNVGANTFLATVVHRLGRVCRLYGI
jgi:hypothetical protein